MAKQHRQRSGVAFNVDSPMNSHKNNESVLFRSTVTTGLVRPKIFAFHAQRFVPKKKVQTSFIRFSFTTLPTELTLSHHNTRVINRQR